MLGDYRVVNLAHVNDPARTSLYPGDPAFTITTTATIPEDGYHLQFVHQGEHTGTHWGAPRHFNADQPAADELDADDLFLPAVKVDIRDRDDPDYAVTVADLKAWEAEHGPIPPESAVILQTGWEHRWGTPEFANQDAGGQLHQPGIGVEATRWLLDTGKLGRRGALGTDTFGPDVAKDDTYAVSKLLYREHRISLEVLANLDELPATGAWVLVGGTVNKGGSGSPASVYALMPKLLGRPA